MTSTAVSPVGPPRRVPGAPAAPAAHPAHVGPAGPLPRHSAGTLLRLRPPVLRRWWTDAVGLVVWGSLLVVVALWVHHGGVQDVMAGGGTAVSSIGRLTGLLSSDLLLLQVLAMARVPFIERSIGQDRLARWHRWVGFSSINLMLAHIVLITVGYAMLDGSGPLGELWSLVTTAPGMLLATAGSVLLGMVAVTSMRVARRRLRYESWHLLHLYAYLGAGLALPHQLWTGTDFLASTAATVYWWSAYVLVMAAVLVWRVIVPWRTSRRQQLRVAAVVPDGRGAVTVTVTGPRLAELAVAAGQFFVWRFHTGPGWTRGHPLSLSAAPTTGALRVTVGVRGDDGPRLASMPPGTRVSIEGPYGRLHPGVRTQRRMVLVGAGLGLAPLVALAQEAHLSGRTAVDGPALLVRRLSSATDVPMQADVDRLVQLGAVRVVDLVGPRASVGAAWLPAAGPGMAAASGPDALRYLIGDLDSCDVFVCGAAPWAQAVATDLRAAGLPNHALHVERFTW